MRGMQRRAGVLRAQFPHGSALSRFIQRCQSCHENAVEAFVFMCVVITPVALQLARV